METIVAMVCITAVELYALNRGINGKLLIASIAVLSGLAGYNLPGLMGLLALGS